MDKKQYAYFMAMGFELVGIEVALIYIGSLIDKEYGWPGYALIVGAMAGLVSWLVHVTLALRKIK